MQDVFSPRIYRRNNLIKPQALIKYGLIFSTVPVIATYIIGHLFKLAFYPMIESMTDVNDPDRISVPIVEFIFPFAILSGLIAFCIWVTFMRRKPSLKKGVMVGLLTVFICYPILGFAIGWVYPDMAMTSRLRSAIAESFALTFFGNFISFWLTYPLGGYCGRLIAKKYINAASNTDADIFS